jgi:antitoxin component of RelBE/YafQ-DinJ toxin-antitoxin module
MPRGLSEKLRTRAEVVAERLRLGCVMIRDVAAMGFSAKQAEYTLRFLASKGRAAYAVIGGVSLWCYSAASVARHVKRLRRTLHEALCVAKVKYASPGRAIKIIAKDKAAARLFTRYVVINARNATTLKFISGLLKLAYGDPVYYREGMRPVYAVDCRRKRLPPLRLDVAGRRRYESVTVEVGEELKDALLRLAAAKGMALSELVEYAVRRLIRKHKAKPYCNIKFKADAELYRDMKAAVEHLGISMSALVRWALERLLAQYKALELKNRAEELVRAEAPI